MKRKDIKKFNGQNGQPAYIIYKNKVYDVTNSRFWKNGTHMSRHKAGEDMTDFISLAPHKDELLKRDNIKYIDEVEPEYAKETAKEKYRDIYSKYHPHPVLIHYPMGILYFGALMLLLYVITKNSNFETTAYYSLVVGTISILPAGVTGIISWWINYDMVTTKIFKNKLTFSVLLITLTTAASIIRVLNPSIEESLNLFWLYVALYFVSIPVLTAVAFNGGRITWPN